MENNQKGFSPLHIVLAVVLVLSVSITAWYVWQAQKNSSNGNTEQSNQQEVSQPEKQTENNKSVVLLERDGIKISAPSIPTGWKTAMCDDKGYIFIYPPAKDGVKCGTEDSGFIGISIQKPEDYNNAKNCIEAEAKAAKPEPGSPDENWFVSYNCEDVKVSNLTAVKEVNVLNENAPFGASTSTTYLVHPKENSVVVLNITDPSDEPNLKDTQTFNDFVKTISISLY